MFRFIVLSLMAFAVATPGFGQAELPEFKLDSAEIKVKMEFLASDELRGRRTGSVGNDMAAAYIAAHLRAYGYQTPQGQSDYYQRIPFAA
ncbi:MAG: peptidase M28, partial [Bacteroidetes bacterium]